MLFIRVLGTVMFVTCHLSVTKFIEGLSTTGFNNGRKLCLPILKHNLYAIVLINSVAVEKLVVSQPVKVLAFYRILVFNTASTRAHHCITYTAR
jgi:hypothetical protein